MTEITSATARYQERIDQYTSEHGAVQGRWSLLANVRLVLFVILAIATWQWYAGDSAVAGVIALATLAALVPVIALHRRLRRQRDRLAAIDPRERAVARPCRA